MTLVNRRESARWVAEGNARENRTADLPAPSFTTEAWRWSWRPTT